MRNLLLFGIGVLVGMELAKSRKASQTPADNSPALTDNQTPTMGGLYQYNPSGLKGAIPYQPYGVRWGSGNQYLDTTKKAQLAI
jgi:hypothetical protein